LIDEISPRIIEETENEKRNRRRLAKQTSGLRGLLRKPSSIYRYFKIEEKAGEFRATAISRNSAPLNEGEIELFQLIRLNWRRESARASDRYRVFNRCSVFRLSRDPFPFPVPSFEFTWMTPRAKYRANFIAAARFVRLALARE